MPDKKSPKEETEEKSGGSKRILTAAVMSIAMLGGGFVIGGKMSGGAAAAPVAEAAAGEEAEAEAEEEAEIGQLETLEAVNVNLQDGHFLRVAVTLEIGGESEGGSSHEEGAVFPTAPAQDLILSTFSGRSLDELATPTGREAARETLLEAMSEKYHGKVVSLYFTEFVMQ